MTQTQIELMKYIESNGTSHYRLLGQKRVDNQFALTWLVDNNYVSAWGNREWKEALFSLTEKGTNALREENHETT